MNDTLNNIKSNSYQMMNGEIRFSKQTNLIEKLSKFLPVDSS